MTTTDTDTDTERDERLRGIQERVEHLTPKPGEWSSDGLYVTDAGWLLSEVARLDAVVTAVRELVSEDYQKTGREVSCGGYLVTDDGCFAGSLANRILRALDGVDKQS